MRLEIKSVQQEEQSAEKVLHDEIFKGETWTII
jgi:hypothetical protein